MVHDLIKFGDLGLLKKTNIIYSRGPFEALKEYKTLQMKDIMYFSL